ncbi:MAG: DUF2442 domain-containing protein [Candidatus Wallbacteria bacterium]|nr:DUF2442 domain-containing protein [Candidatus Wallbacteria bacterium]
MRIKEIQPLKDHKILVTTEEGREGIFDVSPYLKYDVFQPLQETAEFLRIVNGIYYIEWGCGADLSADTIEAGLIPALLSS